MGNKSQVILSIGISLIMMSAISYFMIPYLVPAPAESEEIPSGLILQNKTIENTTVVQKNDEDLTETVIPSMETTITTNGNSTLEVIFSASMFLYIHPYLLYSHGVLFNITLEIEGIANQSVIILHQRAIDNSSYIFAEFYNTPVFLRTETPILAAGTYSIKVWWRSMGDSEGFNRLMTGNFNALNPYFINAKEISA